MKHTLTFITLLLLLLPVWKDCSQKAVSSENNINIVDTAPKETPFDNFLKIFEWDKECHSGYGKVWEVIKYFKETSIKEIKEEKVKINFVLILLFFGLYCSFTVYFLISIMLAVFSFTKKRKTFIWLSGTNLFIIIWAYISYFLYSSNYYQIKFGFYLLIINSLMILLSNFIWKKRYS